MSVAFHQISRNAIKLPNKVVILRLDIGGSQLMTWGLTPLAAALTAVATTLRQLQLGITYMDIKDPEFVDFCATGLGSLVGLERLALDVSHNGLTSVGVDAIQSAIHRTVRVASLNLSWNYSVHRVCLQRIPCVDTLNLDIANTCVESVHVPDSVSNLTMDMRNVQCDSVFVPPTMRIHPEGVSHLTLHLDGSTVYILRAVRPVPSRVAPPCLKLMLDMSDREPVHDALQCIADCGRATTLKMLHLRYVGVTMRESQRFTASLRTWHSLAWLRLEMYTMLSKNCIHDILSAVTGNLECLLGFEFTLADFSTALDTDTLSPCIHFARQDGSLRNLFLDFTGIRLTDAAVALLGCTAVLRRQRNADHTTTFRMQGSSVGIHGLQVLSSAVATSGCVFYFHPPMSADVDNIRKLCSSM